MGEAKMEAQLNSEQDQLITALSLAQAKMQNATLNKTNPHFKNRYADLAAIRDAVIPALTANGLAVIQFTSVDAEGRMLLHTRLAHKSGQFIESTYPIPMALDRPQAMGSALTYARRYSLSAICGIAAEEDDDANEAAKAPRTGVSDITLGQDTLPKSKSRPVYEALIKEMRAIDAPGKLTSWGLENSPRIYSMHADFQRWFREEYQNHLNAVKEDGEPGTEEGSALKKQLKASLEAEEEGVAT